MDYSLSDPMFRAYGRVRFNHDLTEQQKIDYIVFCNSWCNVIDATLDDWRFCRQYPEERKFIEREKVNYRMSYIFARKTVDSATALKYAEYRDTNNMWIHRGYAENLEEWMNS